MNKSYPTDPGVARCGWIAFSDNLWKYVSSTECRWNFLDRVWSRAPVIQKSLPVPSCPGVWHICGPVEGPERCLSRFLSSALGGFLLRAPGHVLDSPLSSCSTWKRNGSGALVHPGKQAATAGKRFFSHFLDSSRCQTEGFSHPIYITTKHYSSYQ